MKKKTLITLSIIGIVLIFTNPSQPEFKNFLVVTKQEDGIFSYGRKYNFLIFSVYTKNYYKTQYWTPPPSIKYFKYDPLETIRDSLKSYYQNRTRFIIKNPYNLDFDYFSTLPDNPTLPDISKYLKEAPNTPPTVDASEFLDDFPDNLKELAILKPGKKFDTYDIPDRLVRDFTNDYPQAIPLGTTKINADSFMMDFDKRLHTPSQVEKLCKSLDNFGFNIPHSKYFIDYYFNHKVISDTTYYPTQKEQVEASKNYIGILKNFF